MKNVATAKTTTQKPKSSFINRLVICMQDVIASPLAGDNNLTSGLPQLTYEPDVESVKG